jgi:hypothetical protein
VLFSVTPLVCPSAVVARVRVRLLVHDCLGLVVLLLQVLLMLLKLLLLRHEHLLSSFKSFKRNFGSVFVCIVDIGSIPPIYLLEELS